MFAKIEVTGIIEVITGMHIGDSSAFSAIGAVDSPIVKDVKTRLPMIPGSSLKGKMRTLLAKQYNETLAKKPDDDCEEIRSLFGSARKDKIQPSRILFSDMILNNEQELRKKGVELLTEVKFENNIKRLSAQATPRQIERAIRGSEFPISIIYEMPLEDSEEKVKKIMKKDFELLAEGFKLLEYDYIGGNGSRGYGRVKIKNLQAEVVIGKVPEETMNVCKKLLEDV